MVSRTAPEFIVNLSRWRPIAVFSRDQVAMAVKDEASWGIAVSQFLDTIIL
jgi:hypothetical protein